MAVFRRRQRARPAVTGHAGDDALLAQIEARSDLAVPRHWNHYLYCDDETGARAAASAVEAGGWRIQRVDAAAGASGWVVIAEQHDVVTSRAAVRDARAFFERVAAGVPGGDYDGWEASV